MSKKALAIALVLLIVLAGAGIVLLRGGNTAPTSTTVQLLPTLQPERVVRMEVQNEGYVQERSRWRHERTGWPVRADLMRNAVRAVSGLSGPEHTGERIVSPRSLKFAMEDGTEHHLRADARGFSGMTYGFTDSGSAEFDLRVLASFDFAPEEAFEPGLFPGLRTELVTSFAIERTDSSLRARRLEGNWLVDLGDAQWARAHAESVRAVIELVRRTGVERVLEARRAPTGMSEREADMRLTFTYRDEAGVFDAHLYDSTIDGGSALVSLPGVERAFVEMGDNDLEEVPTDAIAYAARTALDLVATDVRRVAVVDDKGGRELTRTLDGWDDGDGASPAHAREVDELFTTLTQTEGVPGRSSEVVFESLAIVELWGDDGGLLHTIETGYTDEGAFVVRVGPLVWAYPRAAPPAVLRLAPYRAR